VANAISVTEVVRNFADYINRVVYRGERFVLVRGGRPVAELSPVPMGTRLGDLPSLLRSLPRLSESDAVELAAELECARRDVEGEPPEDRWES
jgi:antitoxin (DNA-binding transcriptional repressor) of toxin-antitoxin stability system